MTVSAQDAAPEFVGSLTWNTLPGGRDLGVPCRGSSLILFGATASEVRPEGGHGGGWTRPNTGAWRRGRTLTPLNADNALWTPGGNALGSVPSACLYRNGTYLAWFTDQIADAGHDWQIARSGVVTSADGGATWVKYPLFEGDTLMGQAAFVVTGDGYTYLVTSEGGRTGSAYLSRTTRLTDAAQYQWWDGAAWTADMSAAAPVIADTVGEASMCWRGDAWLIAYLSPNYNAIVVRESPDLKVWSEPSVLMSWDFLHGVYAPQWEQCGVSWWQTHFETQEIPGYGLVQGYQVYRWQR